MSNFRRILPLKQNYIESHHRPKKNHNNNPSYHKKIESVSKERLRLTVIGNRLKKEFIYCYYMVKGLHKYRKKDFEEPKIRGVTGLEWPIVWNDLKNRYGGKAYCLQSEVAVIVNDLLIGGEIELKEFIQSKYVYNLCLDFYHESINHLVDYISSRGRPCVYIHFSIDGKEVGSMIFMLYADLVPRTCENFIRLCELRKGGYSGTLVHRIVNDCWIQCGGYGLKNSPELGCENFIVPHDRRGVLCMTNDGRDVECSTQFFILLQPAPWMEFKYVAFGQIIEGENTLSKIEHVPTWYESPRKEIIMYKTGVFNMECQYMPVNKMTKQYIHRHIENLYELGQLLYKELLEKVFNQIELNQLKMTEEIDEDADVYNIHDTIYDYDEEDYDEYEESYYSYLHGTNVSLVEKPNLPYYIPLTDVPYPSEIDSAYGLKRLLEGNYCYEDDLGKDIKARKFKADFEKFYFPDELIGALFESFVLNPYDSEDSSSDSRTNEKIEEYIANNMECVSFAGPIVKKIANLSKKYETLEEKMREPVMDRLLTDEELRIIRMAKKNRTSMGEKKATKIFSLVSPDSPTASHAILKRRLLSYVRDGEYTLYNSSSETSEDSDDKYDATRKSEIRNPHSTFDYKQDLRRLSMAARRRTSVLLRLFDDMPLDDVNEAPTLKDYRANITVHDKSIMKITNAPSLLLKQLENRRTSLNIPRFHRIVSPNTSYFPLRKSEQSEIKWRPSISVDQYKSQNKKYQKMIATIGALNKELKSLHGKRQGIRLPGDTPLYLESYTEVPPSLEDLNEII